ncbi:MAG: hypothetical protein ABIK28_06645 [Planctomycetota bacterium]
MAESIAKPRRKSDFCARNDLEKKAHKRKSPLVRCQVSVFSTGRYGFSGKL